MQSAATLRLESLDECIDTQGTSGASVQAQAPNKVFRFRLRQPIRPVANGDPLVDIRRQQTVAPQSRVGGCAAPLIVRSARFKTGAHGIALDIANRRCGVLGVERTRVEATLPDPTTVFLRAIDMLGIPKMYGLEHGGKRTGLGRHCDQMHMVGHQTVGEDVESTLGSVVPKQTQVSTIVRPDEEDAIATIAALGDVVWDARDYDSRHAWHARR
ncbi:MAG TPA: hypothetical protein VMH22_12725 [bacterium]|nr:hypothetical protein [bacterium]